MSQDMSQGALARSRVDIAGHPSPCLPPPAPTRGHQRARIAVNLPPLVSRTQSTSPTRSSTFLPFLRPQSTRSLSPERISAAEAELCGVPTSSQEPTIKKKSPGAVNKLASWFEGSSEPVNITLVPSPRREKLDPVDEMSMMDDRSTYSQNSLDSLTKRPQKRPSLAGPATTTSSKFGFFRRNTGCQVTLDGSDVDELVQMDIHDALFPHGYPDQFSPATFKNLQLNAEGILRLFQQAYREQKSLLRTTSSAKNIQADELEAAQTRNEHLKLQLHEMAERAAEQERLITSMRTQLATQCSAEPDDARQQSVRLVTTQEGPAEHEPTFHPRYRKNRLSDISTLGESEMGSDVSSVISIFSEPVSSAASHTTSISSPLSRFHEPKADCPNCHGISASEAWDVVGMMKMESSALKQRITQLETAQDDALDFLSGLKLS